MDVRDVHFYHYGCTVPTTTYLKKDPESSAESSDRPRNEDQQQQPNYAEEKVATESHDCFFRACFQLAYQQIKGMQRAAGALVFQARLAREEL